MTRVGADASGARALAAIDEGARDILRDPSAPLALVGPEHVRALYRAVSRYERLLPDEIDAGVGAAIGWSP